MNRDSRKAMLKERAKARNPFRWKTSGEAKNKAVEAKGAARPKFGYALGVKMAEREYRWVREHDPMPHRPISWKQRQGHLALTRIALHFYPRGVPL